MDFVEHRVRRRPAEIDTIDLGPKGAGHRCHGYVPIADFRAVETIDRGILCHGIAPHFQYAGIIELSVGFSVKQSCCDFKICLQLHGADAFEPRVPAVGVFTLFGPGNLRLARPEGPIDIDRLAPGEVRIAIALAIAAALKVPVRAARFTANRVWDLIQVARRATAS